jgi:predicted nucleic acid-binding protein
VIAVDTNVIAYLLVPGEHSAVSETIYERDPEWVAPLLWRSEFRNVLARGVREGSADLEDALDALRLAEQLLEDRELQPSGEHVLRLAAASRCSAYDCEFVAVARDLGVRLVTFDREIARRFPDDAVDGKRFVREV